MTQTKEAIDTLCRPIVGIENRTPLEVQDIMSDRIRSVLSTLPIAGEGKEPEGWQLVPVEFTQAHYERMIGRTLVNLDRSKFAKWKEHWEWMLNTAPTAPSSPGKDGGQEMEVGEPHADAMRVIDPDQWEACSPAYLASGGICASAPRVWNAKDKNHWHPKLSAPQPASTALVERLTKALEPFAKEAGCYDPDTGDGDDTVWATPVYFKIRDLREARNALSSSQSTSTEGER